jgi:hypothetical protein
MKSVGVSGVKRGRELGYPSQMGEGMRRGGHDDE